MFGIKNSRTFSFIRVSTALAKISSNLIKDEPFFPLYLFCLGTYLFFHLIAEKIDKE